VTAVARVYPLVLARAIDRPFDYLVPDGVEVAAGALVEVPLGARERVPAAVAEVATTAAADAPAELRPLAAVTGALPPGALALAEWVAATYGSTVPRALRLLLPPAAGGREPPPPLLPGPAEPATERQRQVLAGLAAGPLTAAELRRATGADARTIRRMLDGGVLVEATAAAADPAAGPARDAAPELTPAQREAVRAGAQLLAGGGGDLLVHGVTGSGKTEVYLALIAEALARGRGAIVLVPEIALTPQTAARFVRRFGETVAVLHSALTPARRGREWRRVERGDARVAVGPRSAVFAPVADPGVIVVDEEHDASYKQEGDPRYDARRVAARRARVAGGLAVYGSATPRPESWHGIRRRVELPSRVGGPLPAVEVVDLRRDGGFPFTRPLLDALAALEDGGGRAVLLHNRRGLASALHCRRCAASFRCERCDVALALHGSALRCHHCGLRRRAPRACPSCGSVDLARIGAGTQRVEEELAERFRGLSVLRLDADVADRAGEPEATLERFRRTDPAVLVGTQIVAKGHDVPGVALAAVLDADIGLLQPDFRAEERTFALITQLAGRPGRPGDPRGRVLVQAWNPDARAVALAARHAVAEFLEGEIERRRALGYPPFRRLVRVLVTAPEAAVAEGAAEALADAAAPALAGDALLGPAPLVRLKDRGRSHLIVKTDRPGRAAAVFRGLLADLAADLRRAGATAVVDVDPQTLV
jgi:primosomal protein N' (replication factor Y)